MKIHQYKYLKEHRRPFSNCILNKEWLNIALHCYNESEIEHFCMKGPIVGRLTDGRLMSLRNVKEWF